MNPLIIILGIIIVVIVFYLIKYYFFTTKTLATKIHLSKSPVDISSNVITNPTSILYSFGTWVYVNNFSNCRLLTYTTSANVSDSTLFTLILGRDRTIGSNNKPQLTALIRGKGQNNQDVNKNVIISTNFPIQKWVHVLVSVDTTFIDCYLDGKLIISNPLTPNDQIINSPTQTPYITFQNSGSNSNPSPDIYLAKLTRWDYPLDPQTVWSEYSSGTGLSESNVEVDLTVKTPDTVKNYNIYTN